MFFAASKLLAVFLMPTSLALIAVAAGLVLMSRGRSPRLARRLAWGGLGFVVLAGFSPLGNALLLPLEQRFPNAAESAAGPPVSGIILLGGFEDGWVSSGRGQLTVNESAERLIEGIRLAKRHPEAKVVFTGGVGLLWQPGAAALDPVRQTLINSGIAEERLVLEGASRNTAENASLTAGLLAPRSGERWLLVTSAYHMPRAMGLFRKAGFPVEAYPVDYRLRDQGDLLRLFDRIPAGLQRTDLAAGEWLGLLAYWLTGRIDRLFPAPGS